MIDSPQPANISYLWNFGSLLGVCLILQILTGIFLAMHYQPHVDFAFNSVEHIMRDVNNGWAVRYTHANVASFFFIFVYAHIARGLYYSSYRAPRVQLWTIGVIILIVMMATAFLGKEHSPKWSKFNKDSNFKFKTIHTQPNIKTQTGYFKSPKFSCSYSTQACKFTDKDNICSQVLSNFIKSKNYRLFLFMKTYI